MEPLRIVTLVIAVGWLIAALAASRGGLPRVALSAALLAAVQVVLGVAWPAAAPLALAGWLVYGLTLPDGRLRSATRTAVAGAGTIGLTGWATVLLVQGGEPAPGVLAGAAVAVAVLTAAHAALRCRHATAAERNVLQWLAAAAVLGVAGNVVLLALHVLLGTPGQLLPWLVGSLLLIPLAQVFAAWSATARGSEAALVESIVVAGLAGLVVSVYLVVVVGLIRVPVGGERDILLASAAAAVVVALFALPVRQRLVAFATSLVGRRDGSAEEVLATFGARMSRAVPMDELMLQLAESLRATVAGGGAEIWVGNDGVMTRTVTVPSRTDAVIELGEHERVVVARARIGGPTWTSMWLPPLAEAGNLRVAPVAHLGQLLGLIVVRRGAEAPDFTDDEDRLLVDLARQLGLALHNVRLDSELQASLAQLEWRNTELQASRLRIVTAADESRQAIERNLHDGAQQHLVALAVKLGLARQIAEDDVSIVPDLLDQLREDVRVTIAELRELAHGIYPPLLRDRGLVEALRTAGNRCPLPSRVEVELPGRYQPEVETAAYFCCVEAMQNAGKYAGGQATVTVRVGCDATTLWFVVQDDGAGFDSSAVMGHGFVNMQDRLGAIGGQLSVESTPGAGTTVRGSIPATPLGNADPVGPQLNPRAWTAAAGG